MKILRMNKMRRKKKLTTIVIKLKVRKTQISKRSKNSNTMTCNNLNIEYIVDM